MTSLNLLNKNHTILHDQECKSQTQLLDKAAGIKLGVLKGFLWLHRKNYLFWKSYLNGLISSMNIVFAMVRGSGLVCLNQLESIEIFLTKIVKIKKVFKY